MSSNPEEIDCGDTAASASLFSKLVRDSKWIDAETEGRKRLPPEWHCWVFLEGSLTAALKALSGDEFCVRVLSEAWVQPLEREAKKLGLAMDEEALVRQVELVCRDRVVVFARSIIPRSMFEAEPETFAGLGSKPLGHLLFKDGKARSRKRTLSIFHHPDGGQIFGRVTPYKYHGGEILVSEYFLAAELSEHDIPAGNSPV